MDKNIPKIAVLLAAYNGVQWLSEQLDSILVQSKVDLTVYISIDPSTDGTEDLIAAYAEQHDSVKVLPTAGAFGGAARNFFRLIRDVNTDNYDYIAFADQDDIWFEDKLHNASILMRRELVDAYSSDVIAYWQNGRAELIVKSQSQVRWDFLFEAAGPGCTYVLSKDFAKKFKQVIVDNWQSAQQIRLHDWFCYAFARSNGYKWFIDKKPSMYYRQHNKNQVGVNKGVKALMERYKFINDGGWFEQIKLIVTLTGSECDPFVRTWIKLDRHELIKLSFKAKHCRRRKRDKVLFFLVCWSTAIARVWTR
ncbi:glycosyltransferase [Pseudomonas sp.]|uniref:glycosyltransferase n=1 Tax=Pseudomonas sp. TaxID=306 RepID=UPI00258047AD|nr:glycosyltransferase [Pseudomonas sp.]